MRKIVMLLHTGYCGMDSYEFWKVPETVTDNELYELCWQRAVDNADSYGIYPYNQYCDEPDFDENSESYSDNIEGSFEDYNPVKHDGYRINGDTSWQEY